MPHWAAAWLLRLEESSVAAAIRGSSWGYPAIETLHILGFVVLVGAAFLFDVRLLGAARGLPVSAVARYVLTWSRRSVLLVVPTGLLLFAADATTLAVSPAFRLKLVLMALAGLNALLFHHFTLPGVSGWDQGVGTPPRARAAALCSILLWSGVITCGRWIAYL